MATPNNTLMSRVQDRTRSAGGGNNFPGDNDHVRVAGVDPVPAGTEIVGSLDGQFVFDEPRPGTPGFVPRQGPVRPSPDQIALDSAEGILGPRVGRQELGNRVISESAWDLATGEDGAYVNSPAHGFGPTETGNNAWSGPFGIIQGELDYLGRSLGFANPLEAGQMINPHIEGYLRGDNLEDGSAQPGGQGGIDDIMSGWLMPDSRYARVMNLDIDSIEDPDEKLRAVAEQNQLKNDLARFTGLSSALYARDQIEGGYDQALDAYGAAEDRVLRNQQQQYGLAQEQLSSKFGSGWSSIESSMAQDLDLANLSAREDIMGDFAAQRAQTELSRASSLVELVTGMNISGGMGPAGMWDVANQYGASGVGQSLPETRSGGIGGFLDFMWSGSADNTTSQDPHPPVGSGDPPHPTEARF